METLRLLDEIAWIESYDVQDYRQWREGFYYRLKIQITDHSILFVREYVDETERIYAFHWQDENNELILRWDNAPHHQQIATFPHHKHTPEGVFENVEISLPDVLAEIEKHIGL